MTRMRCLGRFRPAVPIPATGLALLAALAVVEPVRADGYHSPAHRFTAYAEVIDVRPRYHDVGVRESYRDCRIEDREYHVREHGVPPRHHYAPDHLHRPRHRERRADAADVVVGSVLGGVIGNQLGRDGSRDRRTAATVAGALAGGAISSHRSAWHARSYAPSRYRQHRHYSAPSGYTVPVERCHRRYRVHYEERLQGYQVTYRYLGETVTTLMQRDPGSRLELAVSVRPARH